jgi:hypothetical protein
MCLHRGIFLNFPKPPEELTDIPEMSNLGISKSKSTDLSGNTPIIEEGKLRLTPD